LSVEVEGSKGHSARCSSAAAVEPLAWRLCDFNCWLIPDGREAEAPGVLKASAYPSLEPRRTAPAMTADEQSKLAKEQNAARDRKAPAGKARKGAAPVEPMKP
jgi:hypothetical protein